MIYIPFAAVALVVVGLIFRAVKGASTNSAQKTVVISFIDQHPISDFNLKNGIATASILAKQLKIETIDAYKLINIELNKRGIAIKDIPVDS